MSAKDMLSKSLIAVTPPAASINRENLPLGKTYESHYKTEWQIKALAALDKQAQGKFLDRRERRLAQAYKRWRSQQQQQQAA